jgi:hypothetical protein
MIRYLDIISLSASHSDSNLEDAFFTESGDDPEKATLDPAFRNSITSPALIPLVPQVITTEFISEIFINDFETVTLLLNF